jgi:hypothetical protein
VPAFANGKTIIIWVGLTQHHMESARNLPTDTDLILGRLRCGYCITEDGMLLQPIGTPMQGFGVVLDTVETPLSPHQVRTRTDLAKHYAARILRVRALFRKMGFQRAANLYTSVAEESSL